MNIVLLFSKIKYPAFHEHCVTLRKIKYPAFHEIKYPSFHEHCVTLQQN